MARGTIKGTPGCCRAFDTAFDNHTRSGSREIRGPRSKNKMGHQITPVIVRTCPIMIDLSRIKQSGAFYLHVKGESLALPLSHQHCNYLKCEMPFRCSYLFSCGEDTIDKRGLPSPRFFFSLIEILICMRIKSNTHFHT